MGFWGIKNKVIYCEFFNVYMYCKGKFLVGFYFDCLIYIVFCEY